MQFDLFNAPKTEISKIKLEELFDAYFACRNNKRNTTNANLQIVISIKACD